MTDAEFMLEALGAARAGEGHTRPNPPVGAVVAKGGRIVGRGAHLRCGGDHAEVAALKSCRVSPKGATVYVTLEPCSKPGRVGACTEALAAAGVARVVYAVADPNPKNRGRAKRALARHGIVCERLAAGEVTRACARLVAPFAKHVTTGLPFVTVKLAMSLDGRICDDRGAARWISSAESRAVTGALRERVDVVLVGAGTVRRDDPSLLAHAKPNDDLWRAVVTKSRRLPKKAQIFNDAARDRTLVYRDAKQAIADLGYRGFMHVLCEGGLKLATSLAEAGLVDEWITVLAPIVIGHRPVGDAVRLGKKDTIVTSIA